MRNPLSWPPSSTFGWIVITLLMGACYALAMRTVFVIWPMPPVEHIQTHRIIDLRESSDIELPPVLWTERTPINSCDADGKCSVPEGSPP